MQTKTALRDAAVWLSLWLNAALLASDDTFSKPVAIGDSGHAGPVAVRALNHAGAPTVFFTSTSQEPSYRVLAATRQGGSWRNSVAFEDPQGGPLYFDAISRGGTLYLAVGDSTQTAHIYSAALPEGPWTLEYSVGVFWRGEETNLALTAFGDALLVAAPFNIQGGGVKILQGDPRGWSAIAPVTALVMDSAVLSAVSFSDGPRILVSSALSSPAFGTPDGDAWSFQEIGGPGMARLGAWQDRPAMVGFAEYFVGLDFWYLDEGGAWRTENIFSDAARCEVMIDFEGQPAIAYFRTPRTPGAPSLRVSRRQPGGSWTETIVAPAQSMWLEQVDLLILDGVLGVAWVDTTDGVVYYSQQSDCNGNGVQDSEDIASGTSADCNDNGVPDECEHVQIHFSEGPHLSEGLSDARAVAIADLDGDGRYDVAASDYWSTGLSLYINRGDAGFSSGEFEARLTGCSWIEPADFDLDGDTDLMAALYIDGGILPILNSGEERFEAGNLIPLPSVSVPQPPGPVSLAAGDFDGDADLDLAVADLNNDRVLVAWNDGIAGFRFDGALEIGRLRPWSVAAGDFDGDGTTDVVVGAVDEWGDDSLSLLTFMNDSSGGFRKGPISPASAETSIAAGDFDRDGVLDVVTAGGSAVDVCLNDGTGRFAPAFRIPKVELLAYSVAAGDLDGNGTPDLAVVDNKTSEVLLYHNRTPEFDCNDNGAPDACDIGTGTSQDCNLDGIPDECEIARGTSQDCNLNEIPDSCDIATGASEDITGGTADGIPDECQGAFFRRGDPDGDGHSGIGDAVGIIAHQFFGGPAPTCAATADVNGDVRVDISDAIHLISFLFRDGPSPREPFASCGPTTSSRPGCDSYPPCE